MEWQWEIARFGSCGERNLWIGREVNTGRIVELLLAPDLLPGYVVNASGDAAAERARIRRELLAAIERDTAKSILPLNDFDRGFNKGLAHVATELLGRICPEGE